LTLLSASHIIRRTTSPLGVFMQIMIDIDDALESSRRAETAIAILRQTADLLERSDIVQSSRANNVPLPLSSSSMFGGIPDTAPPVPPPPPAFPVEILSGPTTVYGDIGSDDLVSDSDPEVSIDDEGNIAALTTSVPLPPPTPAPPGAPAPELDKRGYPWDNRIHASNRSKKLDGAWKNKRGVDPNLVVAVEAQTKPATLPVGNVPTPSMVIPPQQPTGPVSTGAPLSVVPPPPPVPAAPISASGGNSPFSVPVPPPPPPPTGENVPTSAYTGSTPTPVVTAPQVVDFRSLMQKIQAATAANKLTTDQVNGALASVGLKPEDMAQLIGNAPLIASINAAIDKALS
jgi:hypothetical protein